MDLRGRMLRGISIQARCLDVNGITTSVLEAGAGPPLVLLHGGIECGGVYWAPIIARLADSYRVIVPDAPGLGESAPLCRFEAASFDGWFRALLDHTCDIKPALVAHSLLGSYAARYAVANGTRLERLILYGTPGVGPYRMPVGLLMTAIRFDIRPTARNIERFERWALKDLERTRGIDREWFHAFSSYLLACAVIPHTKRTMRQLIQSGTKQVPDSELRRIPIPTTLLWGRHDRMVPLHLAERAGARLGWPLHVIDDAGHVPHIEQPGAFLTALARELAGDGGRGEIYRLEGRKDDTIRQ